MTDTTERAILDPTEPEGPAFDPEAPYGRTEDGTLLDRKGHRAPYGLTRSGLRKDHKPARKRVTKASKAQMSRPSGRTITAKRRQGLTDLAGVPQGILLGLGYKAQNDVLLADAATLSMHAPMVAGAIADIAEQDDRVAAYVDKVIEVGPFAQIGMVLVAMGAQFARNHGALPAPVAAMLGGTQDPAELADAVRLDMDETMRESNNGATPSTPAQV